MSDRHTVNTINSDALDQLYERRDRAEAALARVRKACDSVKAADQGHTPAVDWVVMRVLEAIDARLVNVPAATFSAAEYEEIKTRWSKTYGKPGTAHPVTEVHPTSEEQPGP